MIKRILATVVLGVLPLLSVSVTALTAEEFANICDSAPGECSDLPVVQAYVGGALDLLATLDEETEYLDQLYCGDPKEQFNMPAIVGFMQNSNEDYAERNAMLLLVRYFEENGGCQADE